MSDTESNEQAEEEKASKPNKDGFMPGQYVNTNDFALHRAKVNNMTSAAARKGKKGK